MNIRCQLFSRMNVKRRLPAQALALMCSAMLLPGAALAEVGDNGTAAPPTPLQSKSDQANALVKLGDRYFEGTGVTQDVPAAIAYYRQAVALGDAKAMLKLGEILALGRGVQESPEEGLALVRQSAGLGNTSAMLLLGDLLARGLAGPDRRKDAIAAYEQAAEKGRALAFVKLAIAYEAGLIVERDARKAVAYYRKAIDQGRSDAMLGLGRAFLEKRFGPLGTQQQGVALLEKAMSLGAPDAVVVLSDGYISGQGVKKDPAKAIALLKEAWAHGNIRAGLRLLSIYRDGRKNAVAPDRFLAGYYLRNVSRRLDATSAQVEVLLMRAAVEKNNLAFDEFREELQQIPLASRTVAVRKLRAINPNAYVYLVQAQLGELKLYQGKANGRLSRETVRAMLKYCAKQQSLDVCRQGPMTSKAAEVMVTAF